MINKPNKTKTIFFLSKSDFSESFLTLAEIV